MHQAGTGLGVGASAELQLAFLRAQQPVAGGGADALQLGAHLRFQAQLPELLQHRQLVTQHRHQALPHIPPNNSQTCFSARYTSWS